MAESNPTQGELTQLLINAQCGDEIACEAVYRYLYAELKNKAQGQLARHPAATLTPTALVNETYLKLFDLSRLNITDRRHFLSLCGRAMRRILIDHYRAGRAAKRGGEHKKVSLDSKVLRVDDHGQQLLEIDDALKTLATHSERLAQVVEYKFFLGLTEQEIAEAIDVTPRTVRMDWRKARAWLARELTGP